MQQTNPGTEIASGQRHPMPFVRSELALFRLDPISRRLEMLLIRRAAEPERGCLALPGGALRIDLDASPEACVLRMAQERLGLVLSEVQQVCAVGGATRDPRAAWTLSLLYRACTHGPLGEMPGKRIDRIDWVDAHQFSGFGERLAFDHNELMAAAVNHLQAEVQAFRFPRGLLPDRFTVAELQQAAESVLDCPLDKVTFRRRLESAEVIRVIPGERRIGPHRPAQLYRLA